MASCGKERQQAPSGIPPGGASIQARLLVNGLSSPVDLQAAPGDTSRLFLVEKTGTIRIFQGGALRPRAFLDISSRVSSGSEQGLLGLAFHPQFSSNRRFYVDYT
ncbi:MAG TPA: PQQ-dependent sugar dehydrogenase, partial [Candidatus Polarisedimenticolia bacterium]|nr:PQQ-dependent sugar dehydrogenase [Candidatus Polarisedimenticolia bacterium]